MLAIFTKVNICKYIFIKLNYQDKKIFIRINNINNIKIISNNVERIYNTSMSYPD